MGQNRQQWADCFSAHVTCSCQHPVVAVRAAGVGAAAALAAAGTQQLVV